MPRSRFFTDAEPGFVGSISVNFVDLLISLLFCVFGYFLVFLNFSGSFELFMAENAYSIIVTSFLCGIAQPTIGVIRVLHSESGDHVLTAILILLIFSILAGVVLFILIATEKVFYSEDITGLNASLVGSCKYWLFSVMFWLVGAFLNAKIK